MLIAAGLRSFRFELDTLGFTEALTPRLVPQGPMTGDDAIAVDYFDRRAFLTQRSHPYHEIALAGLGRVYAVGPVFYADPCARNGSSLTQWTALEFEQPVHDLEDLIETGAKVLSAMLRSMAAVARRLRPRGATVSNATGWHRSSGDPTSCIQVEHGTAHLRTPFGGLDDAGFCLVWNDVTVAAGGLRQNEPPQIPAAEWDPQFAAAYHEAFTLGLPPHGGIAFAMELVVSAFTGVDDLREANLFARDRELVFP